MSDGGQMYMVTGTLGERAIAQFQEYLRNNPDEAWKQRAEDRLRRLLEKRG
jgi:hypothetical protein